MKRSSLLVTIVCALCFLSTVDCRGVPFTPCGKLFNYFESETYEIFGAMTFKNDLSGEYHLVVNMSIAMDTDKNISIRRKTPDHKIKNGDNIEYYVGFPYNHTFPLMTSIVFNGKTYCTGPGEKKTAEHGVTELSARDDLSIKINEGVLELNKVVTPPTVPTKITYINRIPNDFHESSEDCGIAMDFQSLVIKGNTTKSGEYPWLVAMFYLEESGSYKFKCAGNLVTRRHVITAAHCLRFFKVDLIKPADLLLVLGKHNIKNWATKSVLREAKSFHIHPKFEKPGDADIAIVKMQSPVTFTPYIKPICLWNETDSLGDIVGHEGTVVGWGKDESNAEYIFEPKQVQLPIVSQESCLRSDDRFLRLTSNRTFCAGRLDGSSPCTGDSGGGFVMRRAGKWTLRGIVSAALSDLETHSCDTKNYVVFADVPKYTEWILNEVAKTKGD